MKSSSLKVLVAWLREVVGSVVQDYPHGGDGYDAENGFNPDIWSCVEVKEFLDMVNMNRGLMALASVFSAMANGERVPFYNSLMYR